MRGVLLKGGYHPVLLGNLGMGLQLLFGMNLG